MSVLLVVFRLNSIFGLVIHELKKTYRTPPNLAFLGQEVECGKNEESAKIVISVVFAF